jgi:hypothetical protein
MNTPKYLLETMVRRGRLGLGRVLKEAGLSGCVMLINCDWFLDMDRVGSRISNDIAYMEDLSRHRQKLPLYDLLPKTENAFIAPNATLGIN